ncbi:hypothetical protein [Mesonia sp. K4-1]|jgi:hypothetical protein|uniref:hypothetical protein n=1 Tax=Mesonia sp. K4-1 TaxID=2602760 RepID=UPI0011CB8E60|nr:hypothetical protein [Mesonia sp. K4-1]TXK75495.1 hypothetical protein FT986_08230 [Mesonia sp. K4-1]TXK75580.1 hypothetical protein FT986_08685 [Mesonia sp. K4-1]
MKNRKSFLIAFAIVGLSLFPTTVQAQLPGFMDDVDDETAIAPAAPIDGFISLAILMGGIIGYRKLKDDKNQH